MAELRIVAGEFRGRRIKVPPAGVRPTPDRVREAWASIVQSHLVGARVVDLCAGSGALGLEALSRGAAHCDFVEKDPKVRRVLEENIATLGVGERATMHRAGAIDFVDRVEGVRREAGGDARGDAGRDAGPHTSHLTPPTFEIAFADPPYASTLAVDLAERWLRAPFATIFGVEHPARMALPPYGDGTTPDRRTYGITALTFYHLDRHHPMEQS